MANRFGAMNAQVQQDQLFDNVQGQLKPKTHLIQIYVSDPEEAPRLLSEPHDYGTPIMAVMMDEPSCFYCKINVPDGMFTLEQSWGANKGLMSPGYRCCYCTYNRIAVMISKNTIRFKCPISNVPTKDNVKVSIDMGINFHIAQRPDGNDQNDVVKFFYNFGPNRLEELLSEECDEGIRDFLKNTKTARVRDVKSELTGQLKQQLSNKFAPYGVVIEQVNIMNIIIPRDLRFALMQTTAFDVYLQKQVRHQENKMLVIKNNENKEILRLKRDNLQKIFSLQHDIDVEEINLLETEIKSETDKIIKEVNAYKIQAAKLIEANSQKTLAELRSKTKSMIVLKQAAAYKERMHQEADAEAEILRQNADARLEVAKDKTQALVKESASESENQHNMAGQRQHMQKMKLNGALQSLARQGNMVVAGKQGQQVLDFYNNAIDEITKE